MFFLQVLEGPRGAVAATMARIQRDLRHTGVRVLEAAPLERRDFPEWSMTLVSDANATTTRLANPDLVDLRPALGGAEAARTLRAMLDAKRG